MNRLLSHTPSEAEDYRYSQQIAVVVRWFLVFTWMFLVNYRPDEAGLTRALLNVMGVAIIVLNGYIHWRMRIGRPITRRYAYTMTLMDVSAVTVGIGITSGFSNTFFPFYYPALLGMAMTFYSWRISVALVLLVALAYTAIGILTGDGVSYGSGEDKTLVVRVVSMIAVVVAANLIISVERTRRQRAVEAERLQIERNLELQRQAEEIAEQERDRISRDIHDSIAQSVNGLRLYLETTADLKQTSDSQIQERVREIVPIARQTHQEIRHFIDYLKPVIEGRTDLIALSENRLDNFRTLSGVHADLHIEGEPKLTPAAVTSEFDFVLQEALANAMKHANASNVEVRVGFGSEWLVLSIQDDGDGFDLEVLGPGNGLQNIRNRVEQLGGGLELSSKPGSGTRMTARLPVQERGLE